MEKLIIRLSPQEIRAVSAKGHCSIFISCLFSSLRVNWYKLKIYCNHRVFIPGETQRSPATEILRDRVATQAFLVGTEIFSCTSRFNTFYICRRALHTAFTLESSHTVTLNSQEIGKLLPNP